MAFQRGNKLAKGGPRAGSGRPQDWFRKECLKLIKSRKLLEKLVDIADGRAVQRVRLANGEESTTMISADLKDRLKATEMLFDRGLGKSIQPMEVSGKDGQEINFTVVNYANNHHS